jgi:Fe-S-cluster containining protein
MDLPSDEKSNSRPAMACRIGCGACCIAPSLSSPIPGMPRGKPAGVRCIQLTADNQCGIYTDHRRPAVCASFPAKADHCGTGTEEALLLLGELERMTEPGAAEKGRRSPR